MLAVNRYDNIVNTLESLTQSGLCDDLSVVRAPGRTPYDTKEKVHTAVLYSFSVYL